MKNRADISVVLVVLASLTAFTATGLAQGKSGKVEITNDFIVVHPGTKLSKADAKALDDVLKKFDKSLYKIQVYKDGQVTQTMGTLSDMQIDQKASADLADAKSKGQSERAIQVIAPPQKGMVVNPQKGVAVNPQTGTTPMSPTPSASPPTAPVPAGPQTAPMAPVPAGPQTAPMAPAPAGPQVAPSSPVNPQMNGATTNPQTNTATPPQTSEFMQQLTPILEKYSK